MRILTSSTLARNTFLVQKLRAKKPNTVHTVSNPLSDPEAINIWDCILYLVGVITSSLLRRVLFFFSGIENVPNSMKKKK